MMNYNFINLKEKNLRLDKFFQKRKKKNIFQKFTQLKENKYYFSLKENKYILNFKFNLITN